MSNDAWKQEACYRKKVAEIIHNDLIFFELIVASLPKEQPKEI